MTWKKEKKKKRRRDSDAMSFSFCFVCKYFADNELGLRWEELSRWNGRRKTWQGKLPSFRIRWWKFIVLKRKIKWGVAERCGTPRSVCWLASKWRSKVACSPIEMSGNAVAKIHTSSPCFRVCDFVDFPVVCVMSQMWNVCIESNAPNRQANNRKWSDQIEENKFGKIFVFFIFYFG